MKNLFVKTERQRFWLEQLAAIAEPIKSKAVEVDEQSRFPFEAVSITFANGLPAAYFTEAIWRRRSISL